MFDSKITHVTKVHIVGIESASAMISLGLNANISNTTVNYAANETKRTV